VSDKFVRAGALKYAMDEISEADELLQVSHDEPERMEALRTLAAALLDNFEETGSVSNWERSISTSRSVIFGNGETIATLNNLAMALRLRFEHAGGSLDDIAIALQTRFELEGRVEDLERAIPTYRQALDLKDPASRTAASNGICDALRARFERFGSTDDAIEPIDTAVSITSTREVNLAASSSTREEHINDERNETDQLKTTSVA
jgi:hypothetical protein